MKARRTRPNVSRHTTGLRVLAAAGLAAVLFAGVAAIRAGAQAPSRGAQQVVNLLDNPLTKFAMLYGTENGETLGKATAATVEFRPGGAYTLTLTGPDERTVRVERTSETLCAGRIADPTTDALPTKHDGWTVSIDGVLPNPADRSVLTGRETKTKINGDAWLTSADNAVTPLQTGDNGELSPVPVQVTTTWDLRRRD